MTSVLLIAAAARLAFSIETPKTTYLVGEPVVMTVTQHGRARIYPDGWIRMGIAGAHVRVLVDRGRGFQRFQRKVLSAPLTDWSGPVVLDDGLRQEFVLSYDDAIGDVVFPAAGQVRIAFEYEDATIGRVRSNVVTLLIEDPEGEERGAWDAIRALPGRGEQFYLDLTVEAGAPDLSDSGSQAILAAFPRSVYVQGARVRSFERHVPLPSDRFGGAVLLQEAEALADDLAGGQFEPDALAVLAVVYEASGQSERASETWQQIIDRFPRRVAADEARIGFAPDNDPEDDVREPAPRRRP
jgi:hypothetical protein